MSSIVGTPRLTARCLLYRWFLRPRGNIAGNDLYAQWKSTQITDEITVTIKGNTSTATYDGTEKSVTGYTVESSDKRYTVSDFTFSAPLWQRVPTLTPIIWVWTLNSSRTPHQLH